MVLPRRSTRFFSERLLLDADLYLPGRVTPEDRRPGVVICSGYTGLKDIHPARFARALCPQGAVCLAFDYRGYGQSEGERGRLVPVDQVRDLRAAVTFLSTLDEVDPDRIAVIGWALGGGIAIAEAAQDERVRGVATVNAVGDGERATRFVHSEESWSRLLERIEDDRRRRVLVGRSEIVDPFEIVPLDELTRSYVDAELYRVPGFGTGVTLESADALLRFRPELFVDRIAPRPLLIIHASEDKLNPADESRELHRRSGGHSELVLLEG
ncbi:MAG: lysophospholipase, partial [Actinobacteria bacterium]|nr:lysophospholipase [Actinomycetota bacterium]